MTIKGEVGERITRERWVFDRSGWIHQGDRFGVITEVYKSTPSGIGESYYLFAVKWDDGEVERGFLSSGLKPEPLPIGGLGV